MCLLVAFGPFGTSAQTLPPTRIVSLNLCIDQIVVQLVPRERIAAVTHLAVDPDSAPNAASARGLPLTHGFAEDVIARDPDLVLAAEFTSPATLDLLQRLGRRVERVPLADDIAGVHRFVRRIGQLTGTADGAEVWLVDFDRRLAKIAVAGAATTDMPRPSALIYQVNNYASSPGSIADAALSAAGLRNLAPELGVTATGQVALETLVATPPDLLVTASAPDTFATVTGDNLRHPVMRVLAKPGPPLVISWSRLLCGTPFVIDAIEQLAAARAGLVAGRNRR